MKSQATDLQSCTDEDLERALARRLLQAREELPTEAEVQKFYQLHEEIRRRVLSMITG
jgi:hypothetical protein